MKQAEEATAVRVLLVDDDRIVRVTVRDALVDAGFDVVDCADGTAAATRIGQESFDVLLTDIRLPGVDGFSLFRKFVSQQPSSATLLMTAYGKVDDAVTVIREGAHDYITKPFEIDALVLRIQRISQELDFRRKAEQSLFCEEEEDSNLPCRIVGSSPPVKRVLDLVDASAKSNVNVLISGETGTGKELCARMIHCQSDRKNSPFIAVNCAAIPENLLESELFGHERGAFTGADRKRKGRFSAANGGTLFLDEVGSLSPGHQAKILRVVESGSLDPVGADQPIAVDVRILSASNEDLEEAVGQDRFREDLYYRINVINIHMPSLRKRASDIPILVGELLRGISGRQGVETPSLGSRALAALCTYEYPGNVRELIHALEHAVALSRGEAIKLRHLPPAIGRSIPSDVGEDVGPDDESTGQPETLATAVKRFEREYIQRVVERADGNRTRAAKMLGISRKSLWEKLRGYKDR